MPAGQGIGEFRFQRILWDDAFYPAVGAQLFSPAGRLDFNYDEIGAEYAANARYPEEPLVIAAQLTHKWKPASNLRPHLHWIQSQADVPNWLMGYRVWENGAAKPAFTLQKYSSNSFTYSAGDIMQITSFPEIDMSSVTSVSCFIDIKIYRDSANTSTLFAGADPVLTAVILKEYDHHLILNSNGSRQEFIK
jgi:hypothetical protein